LANLKEGSAEAMPQINGSKANTRSQQGICVDRDVKTAAIVMDGDPHDVARRLISQIPLDEMCRSKELMDAFLSEMFLAVSKASSKEARRQRQAEGIAAAKERGTKFGSRRIEMPSCFDDVVEAWERGEISRTEAAQNLGISKDTFSRRVKERAASLS